MGQQYNVITKEEVTSILKHYSRNIDSFDLQLPKSLVFIYKLDKSKVLAYNPDIGIEHGIIFYDTNIDSIEDIISKDEFSINIPNNYPYPKPRLFDGRKKIRNLNNQTEYYWSLANRELSFSYKELTLEIVREYLLEAHKLYQQEKLSDSGYIAVMVVLGEFFRVQIDGKWMLKELYYYYSPFYEINVLDEKYNRIVNIQSIFMSFMKVDTPNLTYLENRLFNQGSFSIPHKNSNNIRQKKNYILLEN